MTFCKPWVIFENCASTLATGFIFSQENSKNIGKAAFDRSHQLMISISPLSRLLFWSRDIDSLMGNLKVGEVGLLHPPLVLLIGL